MKIAVITLGCAKNEVDSEVMAGLLSRAGHRLVRKPELAEVAVVNSCGFITAAKEESIDVILELVQLKKEGRLKHVIVGGCLAQRYARELAAEIPEVDCFFGLNDIPRVAEIVGQIGDKKFGVLGDPVFLYDHTFSRLPQRRRAGTAYIKIADGCDNRCSYCAIPLIRGRLRSRSPDSVLLEAKRLAGEGVRELVVIAQDITSYGRDLGLPGGGLASLLRALQEISGLEWIRVLYAHPERITDELLEVVASSPKVLPYFDIPLQHVDPRILRLMGRKGSPEHFLNLVEKIRSRLPGATLRTTWLVGFPGETEAEFKRLLEFMEAAQFDWAGAFVFSEEEGTAAAGLPGKVPEKVKEERFHRVMLLQREITGRKNARRVGSIMQVLVEGRTGRYHFGRGPSQAPDVDGRVRIKGEERLIPGTFVRVLITEAREYDLVGECVR